MPHAFITITKGLSVRETFVEAPLTREVCAPSLDAFFIGPFKILISIRDDFLRLNSVSDEIGIRRRETRFVRLFGEFVATTECRREGRRRAKSLCAIPASSNLPR